MKPYFILLLSLFISPAIGQQLEESYAERRINEKESSLSAYPSRNIGPVVQGGRVTDIEVHPTNINEYYVAFASGGIFKTTTNGVTFLPVFDDQDALGIGDMALAPSNPNIIYAGTGEKNSSRSSYAGSGLYKSTDAGKTWSPAGLSKTQHIGRVLVHPENPDVVWVASIGALYSHNPDRGVYRSADGGQTWEKTLYINDSTGIIDLVINPSNPDQLWAAAWERTRKAWTFKGDGPGSGIYRSDDGGQTWKRMEKGFPQGDGVGRIGLAVSDSDPSRLYAFLDNQKKKDKKKEDKTDESEDEGLDFTDFRDMTPQHLLDLEDEILEKFLKDKGYPEKYTVERLKQDIRQGKYSPKDVADYFGDANEALFDTDIIGAELYRSDNGGDSWKRVNNYALEGVYFTYGYYFGEVRVAPDNKDEVYVFGVPLLASYDGGETFARIDTTGDVHVDHQALWINPANSDHLRLGNDGGLYESFDGGAHWNHLNNMSVGQFYTVNVDMEKPYNVYGGLQDNGSLVGPSTSVPNRSPHWESLFGGDGMYVSPDPRNSDIVYTGFQFGNYYKVNRKTRQTQKVTPSHDIGEPQLRWNWRAPLIISKHNPDIIYMASQRVYRSLNGGEDFTPISEDLTQDLPQGNVPYSTISTLDESPLEFGLLIAGTDDGLIQKFDKGIWKQIDNGLPEDKWVSFVFASPHDKETIFASLNGYRDDDFSTYVYRSTNGGESWESIQGDMPDVVVNAIVQDPVSPSLLYAGTDHGLYITLDGGKQWSYASSIPNVAAYDLIVHPRENELVVATHGRSMYVMDVKPLQHAAKNKDKIGIYADSSIRHSTRWGEKRYEWNEPFMPSYPIKYYAPGIGDVTFSIKNSEDKEIATWTETSPGPFAATSWNMILKDGKKKEYIEKGKYTLSVSRGGQTATHEIEVK